MSTLDINNYENHRPHSLIHQNLQIVPEVAPEKNSLVIIGRSAGQFDTENYKGLVAITSTSDINRKILGEKNENDKKDVNDGNDLYYAAKYALAAGGGKAFYVINVEEPAEVEEADPTEKSKKEKENLKTAFKKAFIPLKTTDRTLFVVGLTYDTTILQELSSICLTLSSAENQKWKRLYVGPYANGIDGKIGEETVNDIANNLKLFTDAVATSKEAKARTNFIWSAGSEVLKNDNGEVKSEELDGMYNAVIYAAQRASQLPQQGMSRKEVAAISSIPKCYLKFDKEALNQIAVEGITILAQDDEDSEVYVRHQLTNDLSRGIMYYEDSVGVNVDVICYGIKEIVKPYIGQRNNNQATLIEIRNRVTDYLLGLTNTGVSLEERRIGPQISRVDLNSIIVQLDKDLKDRVIISFDIEIPLPLNTVVVHVNAFADLSDATSV